MYLSSQIERRELGTPKNALSDGKQLEGTASLRQIRVLWLVLSRSGSNRFDESGVFLFWKKSRQTKNLQPKQQNKKLWKLSFFTAKVSEKAKKIEILPKFQRWMEKTNILQASFIIYPEDLETFDAETETGITEGGHRRFCLLSTNRKMQTQTRRWLLIWTLFSATWKPMMKNEKIESLPASKLDHLLSKVFLNAWRKKNGEEYEPATVFSFRRSIQR